MAERFCNQNTVDLNMYSTLLILLFVLVIQLVAVNAASNAKVIVTGAAGRTGSLVFKKLLSSTSFSPSAIVRTKKSFKKLFKLGASEDQVIQADVTDVDALTKAFKGADYCILCTSAVPKIKVWSLIKVLVLKLFRKAARPDFYFPMNGDPYNVDWLGAKNQIDAAKAAGVKHFIFLSSMGGTQPENFLNTIGRKKDDDKSGNILLWKRKAEKYLIESGLKYTIIHPGGLTDRPEGQSEVILGVDDELLNEKVRSIPRGDVAEVCVQALQQKEAMDRSIDIIARPVADSEGAKVTSDWKSFFSKPDTCKYYG